MTNAVIYVPSHATLDPWLSTCQQCADRNGWPIVGVARDWHDAAAEALMRRAVVLVATRAHLDPVRVPRPVVADELQLTLPPGAELRAERRP